MPLKEIPKPQHDKTAFRCLTLQHRLSILVCVLLCSTVLFFSFISHYNIQNTVVKTGAGIFIVAAGVFLTWRVTHHAVKPVYQLTEAASAFASGKSSLPVMVNRMDEFGRLASALNDMIIQIRSAQEDFEKKITDCIAQVEKANKEAEEFSSTIAHDLKAPLRGISVFVSMLEEKYGHNNDNTTKRVIDGIVKNTERMGNLINDLLEFSKKGRQELTKRKLPTAELVRQIASAYHSKKAGVHWEIPALPDTFADLNTTRQVWENLISNAVKYSRNNSQPHITIGHYDHKDEQVFYIKDNGVGFDMKYSDKLFKVFQRLHSVSEFEGNGVGLAIVEKIISRHGGKVWTEAEKNKGAAFYFSLPKETGKG